jgi:hypothetical protein
LTHYIYIRRIKVKIDNIDEGYNGSVVGLWERVADLHCESSTDAPTKRDSTLFVVRSTLAPFAYRVSARENLSFFDLEENSDWMEPTRFEMESCDAM